MNELAALPVEMNDDAPPHSGQRMTTSSGASALVDGDRIEVRDPKGRLLFDYDAVTGRGSLTMPAGDLALHAPQGNIDIIAGGAVRCRGAEGVSIGAGEDKQGSSLLTIGKEKLAFAARAMSFSAERADMLFAEAKVHGVRLSATVEHAQMVFDRVETVAVSVVQRAKRVIRHVEGLEQLTAGRLRTLVSGAYSVKAQHASLEAEDDVKIDGKRVNLG